MRAAHSHRSAALAGIAALAAAGLLLLPIASNAAPAAPDPLNCTGYPEPRVFLESQSWWSDGTAPLGGASEHVHSGACFPYKQRISGVVRIDVVSLLHNMPGARLGAVRVQAATEQYGVDTIETAQPGTVCAVNDCTFVTTLQVDTRVLPLDGLTEFRLHSEAHGPSSDPWRSLATNGWIAHVDNGNPEEASPQAVRDPESEGRGWYREPDGNTERGYENARFLDPLPVTPVSGVWRPRIRTLDGAGGDPIVRSFASIDPRFHAMPEDRGIVVLDQAGEFNGALSIDTTRLADGKHRLFLRGDANMSTGRLAGALVIPFTVANGTPPPPPPPPPTAAGTAYDFNGDRTADAAVFRNGVWHVRNFGIVSYGLGSDVPVAGDYENDGDTDIAVFRPSTGAWLVRGQTAVPWGTASDVPVPADYDGLGGTDIAVFRNGAWHIRNQGIVAFGVGSDVPVPADYDRDGDDDIAVYRPSTGAWHVRGQTAVPWGTASDVPVPADYDGDGDADIAVFRPSTGSWHVKDQGIVAYGVGSDVPVPADYDGDGDDDIAVYRPSTGAWLVRGQTAFGWGAAGDVPILIPAPIRLRYYP